MANKMHEAPRLYANRHFIILLFSRTVSILGNVMTPVAMAFYALDREGVQGGAHLALAVAAAQVTQTSLMLFGGVLADRIPRGRLMAGTEGLSALCQAAVALLMMQANINWLAIGVVYSIKGGLNALFLPASGGVIPTVVEKVLLAKANATLRLSMNVTRISGAGISAAIAALAGPAWVLWADAATFALSGLALSTVRWPEAAKRGTSPMLADLRSGWHEFSSRTWVVVPVAQMFVINACVSMFMSVLGPAAMREAGRGVGQWATLVTAQTVGLVLGSLAAFKVKFNRPILCITVLAGVEAFPLLTVASHAHLAISVVAMLVTALVMDVYSVVWDTTLQSDVPEEFLSRVTSYDMLASFCGAPIGLALCSWAMGIYAPARILQVAGIMVLATVPLGLAALAMRDRNGGSWATASSSKEFAPTSHGS